jgi:hypothetical protein
MCDGSGPTDQISLVSAITIDAIRQTIRIAIMYFQLVGIGALRVSGDSMGAPNRE